MHSSHVVDHNGHPGGCLKVIDHEKICNVDMYFRMPAVPSYQAEQFSRSLKVLCCFEGLTREEMAYPIETNCSHTSCMQAFDFGDSNVIGE